LKNDKFWFDNFYANVADGENEYYGKNQSDWGSGAPILKVNKLSEKKHVKIRENNCEYYAKIKVDEYTVHLIQLHYSDSPADANIAFTEDSKKYLVETLKSIQKGEKDIVIVAAHSRTGFFYEQLSKEQRKVIYDKCDLVLSATTHFFTRLNIDEYGDKGPLYLNTGSITYPAGYCPFGYIQVHVLENPFSLVIQYYDTKKNKRQLQHSAYAWIKKVGGNIIATDFRKPTKDEDMERLICSVSRDYSKAEMNKVAKQIYLEYTKADIAYISISSGLSKGEIRLKNLHKVFKYNNEIFALTLTKKQIQEVFEDKIETGDKNEMKIAINSYEGEWIIKHFKLADDKILKTGVKEVDALEKWVKKQK
ncbi:MAG: 5'-nucleotidase C-terminal domain-containing protein, partial [Candidatus Heimdallarchaeota archaeon]|nr:5'-nucleotidase C-terminal domain-containing protein [Candidatus Heimdallarchaeota archaeon]